MAGNYQVAKVFNPDDPSQPVSSTTHTPPGPRYNLVSKGFTEAQNTLDHLYIQTAMNICTPFYNPVVIVEVLLKVFHWELCMGRPTDISERSQERMEDHIISTLHQECLCRDMDPNQQVDQRNMMPRPWPQWGATSGSSGHKEDSQKWQETCFDDRGDKSEDSYHKEHYSRCDGGSQYRCQMRHDESRD